jgi:hypothetical protein
MGRRSWIDEGGWLKGKVGFCGEGGLAMVCYVGEGMGRGRRRRGSGRMGIYCSRMIWRS